MLIWFLMQGTNNRENFKTAQISFMFRYYSCNRSIEALLGVIGIRDILVKNYRDTGYLGERLTGYGIFKKGFPGYRKPKL